MHLFSLLTFLKVLVMYNNKLQGWVRVVILISGIALFAVLFTPIWKIDLDAPQYPEGLELKIYASKLGGNVDIINGLNHYIGMKTLHSEDFIEFKILNYIIILFALSFIVAAILNKRKILNIVFFSFVAFGIIAMIDFWRWEYNYGHTLDPNAAIVVPGMSYQPPLIGFKQLLNFGAYSIPDIGGWIFIAVGALALVCVVAEFKLYQKFKKTSSYTKMIFIVCFTATLASCNTKPTPLKLGVDNCFLCKMNITDSKFGAELITQKGKVYKFDDMFCIIEFVKTETVEQQSIDGIYFVDFANNQQFVKANNAHLFKSDALRSPMNGNIAAFADQTSMQQMMQKYNGTKVNWSELIK